MAFVRPAHRDDLDAILAIHNDAIATTRAIWTDDPVDRDDREQWLDDRRAAGCPVLVAVSDSAVVGLASYGPWHARMGYRFTVEDSVYIAASSRGRGVGAQLLEELIRLARDAGMHVMVADIEAGNAASIRLHERFGFVHAGTVHQVGTKFGQWLDLAVFQLLLE